MDGAIEVRKLLKRYNFKVPIYQRRYEWVEEHYQDFWYSIEEALNYIKSNQNYQDVYFGSMLFHQKIAGCTLDIIDGQQRLITISLCLAAIRSYFKNNPVKIDEINEIIYYDFDRCDLNESSNIGKIIVSERDSDSYIKIINGINLDSIKRNNTIEKSYNFFIDKLKNESDSNINCIITAILNHFKVTHIILDKFEDAGWMFYSVNNLGKKLDELEELRCLFFGWMKEEKQKEFYETYWSPIESEYYDKPFKLMDYVKTIAKYNGYVQASDPIKGLCNKIKNHDKDLQGKNSENFLKQMNFFWDIYQWIINPLDSNMRKKYPKVTRHLILLSFLKPDDVYPIIIKASDLCNFTQKPSINDQDTFIEILKTVETYYIRKITCGNISNISDELKYFYSFKEFASPEEFLREIKMVLFPSLPNNEIFGESLKNSPLYHMFRGPSIINFILFGIEDYLTSGTTDILWNPSTYSIEHIMPQSKNKIWKEYVGEDYEKIHDEYVHNLGNLTIVDVKDQNILGNNSFEIKSEIYQQYSYKLFESIKREKWDKDSIVNRNIILTDYAKKIWEAEGSVFEKVIPHDILIGIYYEDELIEDIKNWNQIPGFLIGKMANTDPKKFQNMVLSHKKIFSTKEKAGFIYISEAEIFFKKETAAKKIAELCSTIRTSMGWTSNNWYGEAERVENGANRIFKFC